MNRSRRISHCCQLSEKRSRNIRHILEKPRRTFDYMRRETLAENQSDSEKIAKKKFYYKVEE